MQRRTRRTTKRLTKKSSQRLADRDSIAQVPLSETNSRAKPSVVGRVLTAADLPDDSDDDRASKRRLILLVLLFIPAGVLWGAAYLSLGFTRSGWIPLGYSLVSAASLGHFVATKRYRLFAWSQLLFILVLPFLLQWSLGGFVASSAVM